MLRCTRRRCAGALDHISRLSFSLQPKSCRLRSTLASLRNGAAPQWPYLSAIDPIRASAPPRWHVCRENLHRRRWRASFDKNGPGRKVRSWRKTAIQPVRENRIHYVDPSTYHFYYGDGTGSPGTILTFFPGRTPGRPARRWRNAARPPSASRCAQSATGRSVSSRREFPTRRRRSASVSPCCLSRIRMGWRSRSSASPMPRMSRAGATRTSLPNMRSAACRA